MLVAARLAYELADAVHAPEEDRQDMLHTAFFVGQSLADQGRPGRWDTIDPEAVLAAAAFEDHLERARFLFALTGLVGHAATTDQIPPDAARTCLERLADLADDAVIARFARNVARDVLPRAS